METPSLTKLYDKICTAIIEEFIKTYFVNEYYAFGDITWYAIGGELDGAIEVNDYFFNLQHMAECLRLKATKEQVFAYDEYCRDIHMKQIKYPRKYKVVGVMNFKSYLKSNLCP